MMDTQTTVQYPRPGIVAGTPRAIMVVGAGRSGTSALTRGVQALGVELGDKLKPGTRKNAKGFFEDMDLIEIDYRLRDHFAIKRSGAGVDVIAEEQMQTPQLQSLHDDAVTIIRERFSRYPVWGFKSGGMTSFLPFWEDVFRAAGQAVSFVMAVRNPLSVARSRAKLSPWRGIQERSDLEWLARMVPYFRRLARYPYVVVDYDRLMIDPRRELQRIATRLSLPLDEASMQAGIDAYCSEFLNPDLRHHVFSDEELASHPRLNPMTRDAYRIMYKLATDQVDPNDPALWDEWQRIEEGFELMLPLLRYITELDKELGRNRGLPRFIRKTMDNWRRNHPRNS